MRSLLLIACCVFSFNPMMDAEEKEEGKPNEALLHEQEIMRQQQEAGMQCDLELLEQEQQSCGCHIEELERDEQLLEQQEAYRQLEQRRKEEELQKRRRREALWERDHSRE